MVYKGQIPPCLEPHVKVIFCIAVLALAGCMQGAAPAVSTPMPAQEPDKLVAQPGQPFIWESKTIRGSLALDIIFHPAAGTCATETGFTSNGHGAGPVYFSRGVDLDGNATGSWSAYEQVEPWAEAGGDGTNQRTPGSPYDSGFGGPPADVSHGMRLQYWATDLQMGDGARFGRSVFLQIVCSAPTELTFRASREALLATPSDFHALAGAGASLAGDATVLGAISARFTVPADWWYLSPPGPGTFTLGVQTPGWERNWTEPSEGANQEPIPPGGTFFFLTGAGLAGQFLVGAAAWQPVHSMAEVEQLPSWV